MIHESIRRLFNTHSRMMMGIAAVAFGLMTACLPTAFSDTPLLAGYAEEDITPPLGGFMPGYFSDRFSTAVLDPLLVKTLVLTQDKTTLVVLAFDLIGLEKTEVDAIRSAVQQKTGIPADHVFVHSTHTHTAAMTPFHYTSDAGEILPQFNKRAAFTGSVDRPWLATLPVKAAAAVSKALKRQTQTQASLGVGQEKRIAFYRRFLMKNGTLRTNPGRKNPDVVKPAGEINPNVYTLSFEEAKIMLVSFGLHLDCIGGTKFSADYPYHLTEAIKKNLSPEWNVVFLNACSGNINHIDVNNLNQPKGYEGSRLIGQALAETALTARKNAKAFPIDKLEANSKTVRCPIRKVSDPDREQAEKDVETGLDSAKRNFNDLFSPGAYVLSRTKDRHHPADITVFRIGSLGLIALPGEVFVEVEREIGKRSPLDPTLVIGISGGSMGYIPHPKGYKEGGYEAGYSGCRYAPSTSGIWIETALELMGG